MSGRPVRYLADAALAGCDEFDHPHLAPAVQLRKQRRRQLPVGYIYISKIIGMS
jgi:hypothetical protein